MTKFRSWNEEGQRFVYFEDGEYYLIVHKVRTIGAFPYKFNWQNKEQSTGLKLGDRTEIFVGDNFFDETDNSISTVVIKEHIFQWELRELYQGVLSEVIDYYPIVDVYLNRIDKLGNTHQNPELLEQQ